LKASAWEIQDKKMAIGSLVHEAVSFIVFRYILMLPEGSAVSYPPKRRKLGRLSKVIWLKLEPALQLL
jgi:hypothetical protein